MESVTLSVSAPGERLPQPLYNLIFDLVPRSCRDLLVVRGNRVLMGRRNIEPFAKMWTLPGGRVLPGESVKDTLVRVGRKELGITVVNWRLVGEIDHIPDGYGPTGVPRHSISTAYVVKIDGRPRAIEQADYLQFMAIDQLSEEDTQPHQLAFLKEKWSEIVEK